MNSNGGPVDLSAEAFWRLSDSERDVLFARLRRERRVSWQRPLENPVMAGENQRGYWAVVRHADVVAVTRDPAAFSSAAEHGGVLMETLSPAVVRATQSIIAMDAPQHTRLRRLVSSAFTARRMAQMDESIRQAARDIVASLTGRAFAGPARVEFVGDVAERLPIWTICEIIGLPAHERDRALHLSNVMAGCRDTAYHGYPNPVEALRDSLIAFSAILFELIDERRHYPDDDLTSALIEAEVDGHRLSDSEVQAFLLLLFIAGNETTRHAISHGMLALSRFPDQRRLLEADLPGRISAAVEEILRWSTPIMTFRRTATRDLRLGGSFINRGDAVVMFYSSANRDESVFPDPWRFDITRAPQSHIAFGGGGPHFCLGAHLARAELRHIFTETLRALPGLTVGKPRLVAGNFVNAIGRLPGTLLPTPTPAVVP